MTNPSEPTLEGMAVKFAVSVAVETFKECLKGIEGLGKRIRSKSKEYDLLDRAAKNYVERFEERYNCIRVFGINKPIPLTDIYITANILEKITARQWKTVEDLEKAFERDSRGFGIPKEAKTGLDIAREIQRFIVLGKPGSGKTTYLKYIGLQAFNGRLGRELIPIFISLKELADSGMSLMDYTAEQFDICQFPEGEPFIERILQKGRCLLLLDGLDEVGKEKSNEIVREIRNFADKYNDNCFILTCRIAAYNFQFGKFTDVEMADFTDKQIQGFINSWFGKGSRKAESCWSKLCGNPSIKELASVPLLLTLLCITFEENMDFPRNRAELYRDAVDALLRKWDASRGIERDEIYKNLSVRRKESMFSRIAAETFEKDQFFMPRKTLERHIADFIENLPEANQETLEPDSEAILKAVEAQHGILVERAKGIYSFSHLTFQEYFTAKYIVDNEARGALQRFIEDHLTDDEWRDVFLITAGMLEEADNFLLIIKQHVDPFLSADKGLTSILKDIQRNLLSIDPSYALPVYRAIAICYILVFARARDFGIPLDHQVDRAFDSALDHELGLAFGRALSLVLAFDFPFTLKLTRARVFDLKFALDRASLALGLGLDRELASDLDLIEHEIALNLDLGPDRDDARDHKLARAFAHVLVCARDLDIDSAALLNAYLQANKLLVDCLNTDCYIRRDTRQKILDELLTVTDSLANDT